MGSLKTPAPAPSLRDQVTAQLAEDLAIIPSGHSRALIAIIDERGMRAGFAARVEETWEVGGELEKRWRDRGARAHVAVRGSW